MGDDRIKRPAYQWNVVDAHGDEVFQLMTYEQQGIYRALLDRQWVEGSIPADPKLIFALLPKLKNYERFKTRLWPLISGKFQPHASTRLQNARLERYRAELEAFCDTKAENGRKGGRPRNLQVSETKATESSLSLSLTETTKKEPERESAPTRTPAPSQTRTSAPLITQSAHRNHAMCGVVCLPSAMYEQFLGWSRHRPDPRAYISRFFDEWNTRYFSGDRKAEEISGDAFDFWRERWTETHPKAAPVKPTTDITAIAAARIAANDAKYGRR